MITIRSSLLTVLWGAATLTAQDLSGLPESLESVREALAEGNAETAFKILEAEAQKGNSDAAYGIGEMHLTGATGKVSPKDAIDWYQKAADSGQAQAHFRLGEIFLQGLFEQEADRDRGRFHLQAAAESGYSPALAFLGKIAQARAQAADSKPLREQHFAEARSYFEKGASSENLDCLFGLAVLLGEGQGGKVDKIESQRLLSEAASRAHLEAMNEYGFRLQRGQGMEPNAVEALGWFLAAAERGSVKAMTNLGTCYSQGVGVPQNYDQAGRWYSRAANAGFPMAQYLLAQLYEKGLGTQANPVFAYANYFKAARSGLASACEPRDRLKGELNEKQLSEAEEFIAPKE